MSAYSFIFLTLAALSSLAHGCISLICDNDPSGFYSIAAAFAIELVMIFELYRHARQLHSDESEHSIRRL